MIVILTGSKYGNCNRQEYLQPTSDCLRSRAVLVEHSKIKSISFQCCSTDRGTHLSQSILSCLPKPQFTVATGTSKVCLIAKKPTDLPSSWHITSNTKKSSSNFHSALRTCFECQPLSNSHTNGVKNVLIVREGPLRPGMILMIPLKRIFLGRFITTRYPLSKSYA